LVGKFEAVPKKGEHSVLFFKPVWGQTCRHNTPTFPVKKGEQLLLFCFVLFLLFLYFLGEKTGAKTYCPAKRLKGKTLCRAEFLSHVILSRSQCHTAAAEGAKLSKISPHMGGPRYGSQNTIIRVRIACGTLLEHSSHPRICLKSLTHTGRSEIPGYKLFGWDPTWGTCLEQSLCKIHPRRA
jgi:hypothetical protein